MSKKKIIGITIAVIVGLIIVLGLIFFKIDSSRVAKNEAPIFTKHMKVSITDTSISGYDIYYGLGYKIMIVKISEDENYTKISPIWEEDDIFEACKRVEEIKATKEYRDKELEELPQNYSLEQAVKDDCFVITHDKVYNKNKLNKFIKNAGINSKNRIEDKIRIVQFTIEGDPIITDLEYKITDETYLLSGKPVNKTKYIMRVDRTRDKFSATEDRKITENDKIPGEIYGITTRYYEDMVEVSLDLYAQIQYENLEGGTFDETIVICTYPKDAQVINAGRYDTDKITITKNNEDEKLDITVDITDKTEIDNIISKCNSIVIKDIDYEPMIVAPDYEISFNNGVTLLKYNKKDRGFLVDEYLHEAYGLSVLDSIIEKSF